MPGADLFEEANRQLTICNACRYCEGYCPVFRAIETRRHFAEGDVLYLANLCHDCRACYYACMYTPPHEFAINIPQLMSEVRAKSYERWSWPVALAHAFARPAIGISLGVATAALIAIAAFVLVPSQQMFAAHIGSGAFYQVIPYLAMVIPAVVLFLYGLAIWLRGGLRSWLEAGKESGGGSRLKAFAEALGAGLNLTYLRGGGPGCTYPDERPSGIRAVFHSLTVWGLAAAFASTTLAFIYQELIHWQPPYPLTSGPVIFGSVGGVALIVGTCGLIWCKLKSDPVPAADGYGLDYMFLITLGLTALTGMLTLILRATPALGTILTIHLALVAALFITAPYGKFVHFIYRLVAIARYQIEQSQAHQHADL